MSNNVIFNLVLDELFRLLLRHLSTIIQMRYYMRRRALLDKRQGAKISICFVLAIIVFIFILFNQKISQGAEVATLCEQVYTVTEKAKKVLILNSYHEGFSWTREQNESIIAEFQECGSSVDIMTEFIDWKNYPYKENLEYLHEYYLYKYSNKDIDIVITTDDIALNFALRHRDDIFSDAPIIFSGVNEDGTESITSGFDRLTGVMEVIDPTKTIETALKINPSLKNIYIVFDNSESGLSTGKIVIDKIKQLHPELNLIPCNDMLYDDLIEQVKVLEDDSIVYITTYYKDVIGRVIDAEYATNEISLNSKVPVYHLYDFGLYNGTIGGSLLSGRVQGELASNLAKRVLQGENIDDIPVVVEDSMITVYDYEQLERFEIPNKLLPKDAEIINKPFSFYETYKGFVNGIIIAFSVLIIFVIILLGYIKRIRKMRRELSESHEELTQTYEELTATDEEIRKQYDEMLIINERIREGEEKLLYLAYHDSLTGILNKHSLLEASDYIFTKDKGKVALFFIDIDNFKYVNDTMGHAFGDQLIIKVCARLSTLLDGNASLYRHSGDEFIFILENISGIEQAEEFAQKLLDKFDIGFELQGSFVYVGISMGIAIYPDHGLRIEQLLEYADIAMYHAKDKGKKNFIVYDKIMKENFAERVNIEKYLYGALDNNEFKVFYQPQFDTETKKITGLEALLRWESPVLGNVSPLKFIRIAEDIHVIIPIGTWVLQQACSFLSKLHGMGYTDITVSVNISIRQLLQIDFSEIVLSTLEEYNLEPEFLELEITESMLIKSFDSIAQSLEKLHSINVRIALDDFGMGYSSLNYLTHLPIDTLKIDKSFIDTIINPFKISLAGQIVKLGKSIGLSVVAEGVEYEEQADYLEKYDCDKIQGFLYCRPIPEDEIIELLESERRD